MTDQTPPVSPLPDAPVDTEPAAPKRSAAGTIVAAIIALGVVLLGGLYVWGAKLEKDRRTEAGQAREQEREAAPNPAGLPPAPPALPSMQVEGEGSVQAQ